MYIQSTLAKLYCDENGFKRFMAYVFSHLYTLPFFFIRYVEEAWKKSFYMKKLQLINHPFIVFLDMFFCYVFFGYFPSAYASFSFQKLTLKQRLTFLPSYENNIFSLSLNKDGNTALLANKGKTFELFNDFFCRDHIVIESKTDLPKFLNFAKKHSKFFYKPLKGSMGLKSGLANIDDIDLEKFFNSLVSKGSFILEELIVQCKELSSFHPSSVNTIRVVVFKSLHGTELLFGSLRCGQKGGVVDNGGAGGIFIPYNVETGRLQKYGFDENGQKFIAHPDTNIVFENYQIPRFEEIKALAFNAAEQLPGLRYVGWDVAVGEDKLMLVEGNSLPTNIILEGLREIGFKKELRELARTRVVSDGFRNKQKKIF